MTRFLKLTSNPNGNVVLVNIDKVEFIETHNSGASVYCGTSSVAVLESVNTIIKMIEQEEVVK